MKIAAIVSSRFVFVLFGLAFLSTTCNAVEKIIQMNCVYVSEKSSDDAFEFGKIYKLYGALTENQKQQSKKFIDDMLEVGDNKQYQIRKLMEKNAPNEIPHYLNAAYIEQKRFGWEYAKIIAESNPGKDKLSYERMIYDECMKIAVRTERESDNSPAQIERMKQIYRLQLEALKPAPTPTPQQQNNTTNPSRPINCFSRPDGPGSSRMITTCF
jgi:hypothetical protein